MIESIFLYKNKLTKMTLKQLKTELDRKRAHNKYTGNTLAKIWILTDLINKLDNQ